MRAIQVYQYNQEKDIALDSTGDFLRQVIFSTKGRLDKYAIVSK
jgi:hypothetical protein